ncbi:MAG: DUF2339 domain-containing protein [Pseudomonadota bacterium]
MIELLIGMVLLAPLTIIILLVVNFSRTSRVRESVNRLQDEVVQLRRTISDMQDAGSPPLSEDAAVQVEPQDGPGSLDVDALDQTETATPVAKQDYLRPAMRRPEATYSSKSDEDISDRALAIGRTEADRLTEQTSPAASQMSEADEPYDVSENGFQDASGIFSGRSFEDVIGGKLPIWIGGIALIFAAFFLVRFTIEAGLFGPRARSITAALFGLLLIGMSEFGKNVPRLGIAFAEDRRIGQSLAGAGIAILYATLYMASELYGLLPLLWAFALVVAISALAFALALQHGPATAIMGVVGGFAAPFVAGMNADNLPLLLSYLGVFMAALFALSIWQRWLWLMLMAVVGGGIWTLALLETAIDGLPLLGLFIVGAAIAAIASALRLDKAEEQDRPDDDETDHSTMRDRFAEMGFDQIAIYLPQAVALVQLCILLPRLEFTPLGWGFLFAISVLSLLLAWRDKRLLLLASFTAIGFLFPMLAGWYMGGKQDFMLAVTLGYMALFAGTAHIRIQLQGIQTAGARGWALMALLPVVVTYFILIFQYEGALSQPGWGFIGLTMALLCTLIAWRFRETGSSDAMVSLVAAAVTALLVGTGLMLILPGAWLACIAVAVMAGVAAWGHFIGATKVRCLSYIPLLIAALAMLISAEHVIGQMVVPLAGGYTQYDLLPPPSALIVEVLLPALLLISCLFVPQLGISKNGHIATLAIGSGFAALFVWLLAKQPFAIVSYDDFMRYGFHERAIITLVLAALGGALFWRGRDWMRTTGLVFILMIVARFVWFDLIMFNPVLREQAVGPWPLANMAVLLCAVLALLFWWLSKTSDNGGLPSIAGRSLALQRWSYGSSLILAVVTALVLVRQGIHGDIIADLPVTTTENYLYSAALLLLALAWLGMAIWRGGRTLRQAGLGLLTLVTLKVFLIDAAALEGLLRIVSFLGLGIALIVIGWAYRRLLARDAVELA